MLRSSVLEINFLIYACNIPYVMGMLLMVMKCVFILYGKNQAYIGCHENKSAIDDVAVIVIIIISSLSL